MNIRKETLEAAMTVIAAFERRPDLGITRDDAAMLIKSLGGRVDILMEDRIDSTSLAVYMAGLVIAYLGDMK